MLRSKEVRSSVSNGSHLSPQQRVKFTGKPSRATFSYLDENWEKRGPFCIKCMRTFYSDQIIKMDTDLLRHTYRGDEHCFLYDMTLKNGSLNPFEDRAVTHMKFLKNLCSSDHCPTRGLRKDQNPVKTAKDIRGRPESRQLSCFYRKQFGNGSPEQYINLRMYGFEKNTTPNEVKEVLEGVFRPFRPLEIRAVVNEMKTNNEPSWWIYANFVRAECAKTIRNTMMHRLCQLFGSGFVCDPAGIIRDQGGKFMPDKFMQSRHSLKQERHIKGKAIVAAYMPAREGRKTMRSVNNVLNILKKEKKMLKTEKKMLKNEKKMLKKMLKKAKKTLKKEERRCRQIFQNILPLPSSSDDNSVVADVDRVKYAPTDCVMILERKIEEINVAGSNRTTSTFLSSRGVGSYTDDEEDSTDDDSLNEESGSEEEEDGYSEDVLHSES